MYLYMCFQIAHPLILDGSWFVISYLLKSVLTWIIMEQSRGLALLVELPLFCCVFRNMHPGSFMRRSAEIWEIENTPT